MKKTILFLLLILVPALVLGATLIITNQPLTQEDAELYYITGNAFYKQNDYEAAIKNYKKAVSINPLYEEAHNNLAFLYNKLGDYKKAAYHLAELIKINPANPSYHYDYAINLVLNIKKTKKGEIEDIETALHECSIAESLEPGYSHAKENIAFLEGMRDEYYSKQG
ncbi:hypothetical protein AYK26_04710 [Euryarchaeota archaeon SM23-78]|nr:MAG: hypothetical protein AYK26_04710 [Euryarchaeota archaeon SM23-78]MBW3001176.1 tetratricopeptide repeat protein [Candidatus Woesearchaeota archaeon]